MNTSTEAFYFAMSKINELREEGIEVTMKPSISRNNKDIIEKYKKQDSGKERIPTNLWYHISFKIIDGEDAHKIQEMKRYLGMCGIGFDTGGWSEGRDWEFDWSFKYVKGEENWEWIDAGDKLEDMIKEMTI